MSRVDVQWSPALQKYEENKAILLLLLLVKLTDRDFDAKICAQIKGRRWNILGSIFWNKNALKDFVLPNLSFQAISQIT